MSGNSQQRQKDKTQRDLIELGKKAQDIQRNADEIVAKTKSEAAKRVNDLEAKLVELEAENAGYRAHAEHSLAQAQMYRGMATTAEDDRVAIKAQYAVTAERIAALEAENLELKKQIPDSGVQLTDDEKDVKALRQRLSNRNRELAEANAKLNKQQVQLHKANEGAQRDRLAFESILRTEQQRVGLIGALASAVEWCGTTGSDFIAGEDNPDGTIAKPKGAKYDEWKQRCEPLLDIARKVRQAAQAASPPTGMPSQMGLPPGMQMGMPPGMPPMGTPPGMMMPPGMGPMGVPPGIVVPPQSAATPVDAAPTEPAPEPVPVPVPPTEPQAA